MKSSCRSPLFFDRHAQTVHGAPVAFRRRTDEERRIHTSKNSYVEFSPFVYVGRLVGTVELALWTECGRWREDGTPHPQDLAVVAQRSA